MSKNYRLTPKDTAQLLKATRKSLKLTQEVIAKRLGVSQGTLSKMERAIAEPSAIQWLQFCKSVGMPSDILFEPGTKVKLFLGKLAKKSVSLSF